RCWSNPSPGWESRRRGYPFRIASCRVRGWPLEQDFRSGDDLPARGQVAEDAAPERVPVHEPLGDVAGRGVAPEHVGKVVAVEVAGALRLPGSGQIGEDAAPERVPVHEPLGDVAGRGVAPEHVGAAVPIEVAGALTLPVAGEIADD